VNPTAVLTAPAERATTWERALTEQLVAMHRAGLRYAEIADALGVDQGEVEGKAASLRARGVLQSRDTRRRRRATPNRQRWDPGITAEVVKLREEGRYRKEIRAITCLTDRELKELIEDLRREGRSLSRASRRSGGQATRKVAGPLSADRVRAAHKAYQDGGKVQQLAADLHVSPSTLYGRFRLLELPLRSKSSQACERALKEALAASGGADVSWRRYEHLRSENPNWPCASTVARVLGNGSLTAAKRAVGLAAA